MRGLQLKTNKLGEFSLKAKIGFIKLGVSIRKIKKENLETSRFSYKPIITVSKVRNLSSDYLVSTTAYFDIFQNSSGLRTII